MSVLKAKIISMMQSFTYSENEIAQYILDHIEEVATANITNLAEKTKTSEASINRFSKKLGYKGFNHLKIALVQERFYREHNNSSTDKSKYSLVETMIVDYQDLLANAASLISEENIRIIAEKIAESDTVYILCTYRTKHVSIQLERRLSELGIHCKIYCDATEIRLALVNMTKKDMALVVASNLIMKDFFNLIPAMKERNMFIAAFVSFDSQKLSDVVHASVVISDKIICTNSLALTNDIIYIFAFDLVIATLLNTQKKLKARRMEADSILNYLESVDRNLIESL